MQVFPKFGKELFEALAPGFPKSELLRYDGNVVGGLVHVRLLMPLVKLDWISEITEVETQNELCYFVDQGIKLPPFLKTWRHKHIIQEREYGADIIEDISYTAPLPLMDLLLYPQMNAMFSARKMVYQAWFGKPNL